MTALSKEPPAPSHSWQMTLRTFSASSRPPFTFPNLPTEQSPPEALASLCLQLLPERCALLLSLPVLGLQPGPLLLQLLRSLLGLQALGALPLHIFLVLS